MPEQSLKFRAYKKGEEMKYIGERLADYYPDKGWEITQFTGLVDKKNNDIYQGDIVKNEKGQVAEVRVDQHEHYFGDQASPAFGVNFWGDEGFYFSEHLRENGRVDVEVVGNIFENPELLKF